MTIFLLRLTPWPQQRREVLDILRRVKGPTSANPDCLTCGIYEGADEDSAVLYLEEWASMGAVEQHIQSPLFSKILAVMDLSMAQPDIHFYQIAKWRGLDLVEALRGQQGTR